MFFYRKIFKMLIFVIVLSLFPIQSLGEQLDVNAKSAVLIDAKSGQVIFEKNSHEKLPPASVTKIMTMLLVLEAVDKKQVALQDKVTISERAAGMGGSQLYMEAGEQQTLETLMKGIAICSANDACVAAAEYVGGTEENFVDKMNKRAKELGMNDSNFANTNGLPAADHYTSAHDIALMSRELMKHNYVKEWFATWMTKITVGLPDKKRTELEITNTNKLIKFYPGANGVKTGYTDEALYCLSASATRGNMTLISVIMGAPTSKIRFAEAARLLDYGFAAYDRVPIAGKNEAVGSIAVEKGNSEFVNAVSENEISILVKKDEKNSIKKEIKLPETVRAPIKKGDLIGEIIIYKDGKVIEKHPLISETDVKRASLIKIYFKMLKTVI